MVDLLAQHHESGRRFDPVEFLEAGPHVAVRMNVSDVRTPDARVDVFKVFTFGEPDERVVLLRDCIDHEHALQYLAE